MNEIARFEELIKIALSNIEEYYYYTAYNNIEAFRNAIVGRIGRFFGDRYERYGERVFCYEFYHQMRLLIDSERSSNPNFLKNTHLQGEVQKWQVWQILEMFKLKRLNGQYIPDFLMHTPGNADTHAYIIEVKCKNNLSARELKNDLDKINEFITRFYYKRGALICINISNENVQILLNNSRKHIAALQGKSQMIVLCKTNKNAQERIWELNEFNNSL